MICFVVCPVLVVLGGTVGTVGHGLEDSHLTCWPLTANAELPQPYASCPGVTAYWTKPEEFPLSGEGESVIVDYYFGVSSSFYPWAVQIGIFDKSGSSGFRNAAAAAQQWCEETQCPNTTRKANQTNCCLHYVSVHYCPPRLNIPKHRCRPWLMEFGILVSPSKARVGPIDTGNWTSTMEMFESPTTTQGNITVMAVFKLAGMLIVLDAKFMFRNTQVCGNGKCDGNENCTSCQRDCGVCMIVLKVIVILIVSILGILIILVFLFIMHHRRKQYEALNDETWIIEPEEIIGNVADVHWSDSTRVNVGAEKEEEKKKGYQYPAISALVLSGHRKRLATLYRMPVATVRGEKVAVKKYHNDQFQLTRQIRREVLLIRMIQHPNLCRFVGATVQPGIVYILFEYCPKGSLIDLLQKETISLSWSFRFSMVADVSRGMAFLHRHNVVHGNLKTSNCVVDDRWICKVTDYGLREYRREVFTDEEEEELLIKSVGKERQDMVYRAPEADDELQPASDVYSFAIILTEVAKGERVYTYDGDSKPVIKKPSLPRFRSSESIILDYSLPGKPSNRTESGFAVKYEELITKCWEDNPENRPTFEEIEVALMNMHPNKKNPVDSMMALMQMYSKNLEQLVEKRSRELLEEKQKTEALLYNILPKPVADNLRNGRQVRAESYKNSTVFFSDIVAFTTLSSRSTPMQIVDLLNKLYTTFDSIIEKYNVYKVETIGDAYMVVSGVPNRTDHHAYHAALMALGIMAAVKRFTVPHLPDERIYIKIGLHSGPVCAGVVGIKMPRYCLFGDTVNTASRMETYSKAGRIHISDKTHNELRDCDFFNFESRGIINVKGKGNMVTWWLLGLKEQSSAFFSVSGEHMFTKDSSHDVRFLTNVYGQD